VRGAAAFPRVPAAVARGTRDGPKQPAWRRFLYGYCVVFALETMLDPFATVR